MTGISWNIPLKLFLAPIFWIQLITPTSAGLCDHTLEYKAETKKLLTDVLSHDKLNLIIVLDVSYSIGIDLFHNEVSTFAVELINFGIKQSGMKIHPDYAQVQFITFSGNADTKTYNTGERPLHACEIYERLQKISERLKIDGPTQVHVAFNASWQVFQEIQRPGDKKVLFLVSDVGFTSYLDQVHTSVGVLHSLGVDIFTIGVGRVGSQGVDKNIQSVIEDDMHFLCYKEWELLLNSTDTERTESGITWADVTENQKNSSCPACGPYSHCRCNVNQPQYMCVCDNGYYKDTSGLCQECPREECSQSPDGPECLLQCFVKQPIEVTTVGPGGPELNFGLILGLTGIGLLFLLFLLLLLILLCKWKRYRKADSTRPGGVQAFFNFIFMGPIFNVKNIISSRKSTPSDNPRNSNPYVIDPSAPSSRPPSLVVQDFVPMYTQKDTPDNPCSVHSSSRSHNNSVFYEDCSVSNRGHSRSVSSSRSYATIPDVPSYLGINWDGYEVPVPYSNMAHVAETSRNEYEQISDFAQEWTAHITKQVERTDLESLAVYCKQDDSLTATRNIQVHASDISRVQKLIQSEGTSERSVFPMSGKMYEVKVHHQGNSLYAEEIHGGKDKSAIWVINTEHHLVVGVGIKDMALKCEKEIGNLALEVESKTGSQPN